MKDLYENLQPNAWPLWGFKKKGHQGGASSQSNRFWVFIVPNLPNRMISWSRYLDQEHPKPSKTFFFVPKNQVFWRWKPLFFMVLGAPGTFWPTAKWWRLLKRWGQPSGALAGRGAALRRSGGLGKSLLLFWGEARAEGNDKVVFSPIVRNAMFWRLFWLTGEEASRTLSETEVALRPVKGRF